MNKKTLIILIIAALILIGLWIWQKPEAPAETTADTTAVINKELESLDVGDLEKEFQSIDADLNTL